MLMAGLEAVAKALSAQRTTDGPKEFVARLAEYGFKVVPRHTKPKPRPKLKLIKGGLHDGG